MTVVATMRPGGYHSSVSTTVFRREKQLLTDAEINTGNYCIHSRFLNGFYSIVACVDFLFFTFGTTKDLDHSFCEGQYKNTPFDEGFYSTVYNRFQFVWIYLW